MGKANPYRRLKSLSEKIHSEMTGLGIATYAIGNVVLSISHIFPANILPSGQGRQGRARQAGRRGGKTPTAGKKARRRDRPERRPVSSE